MNYRLAYAIGFHPLGGPGRASALRRQTLASWWLVEDGRGPPYGRGARPRYRQRGLGVRLAQRGWDVTGVDIVEKALRRARERVDEAGAEMRLVHGDVTALREAGVGSGFRLVLDTGTFHGLSDAQRAGDGPAR